LSIWQKSNFYLVTSQRAWIIPGIKKHNVRTRFMRKSFPTPLLKKTANGGRKTAATINSNLLSISDVLQGYQ
jgi:hypothetical protein